MKNFYVTITIILFSVSITMAQTIDDTVEVQRNENGKITFARFKSGVSAEVQNAESFFKSLLNLNKADELRFVNQTTDLLE